MAFKDLNKDLKKKLFFEVATIINFDVNKLDTTTFRCNASERTTSGLFFRFTLEYFIIICWFLSFSDKSVTIEVYGGSNLPQVKIIFHARDFYIMFVYLTQRWKWEKKDQERKG